MADFENSVLSKHSFLEKREVRIITRVILWTFFAFLNPLALSQKTADGTHRVLVEDGQNSIHSKMGHP